MILQVTAEPLPQHHPLLGHHPSQRQGTARGCHLRPPFCLFSALHQLKGSR